MHIPFAVILVFPLIDFITSAPVIWNKKSRSTKQIKNVSKSKAAKCDVTSHQFTRERRFVLQNTIWTKPVVTWRIDTFTEDLPERTVQKIMRRSFRKWAVWIPLRFVEKRWGAVDISISFVYGHHAPCSVPFDGKEGNIAHAYYPYQGQDIAGDIHFDDAELFTEKGQNGRSLAWTALHEIGHSLGLKHSNVWGAVMSPYYDSFYHPWIKLSLSTDDITGIQQLYGTHSFLMTSSPRNLRLIYFIWILPKETLLKVL